MTNSMAIQKKENIFKRGAKRVIFMWRNKRHFKMQTFGMGVLVCVLIFILNIVSINVDYNNMLKNIRENTTVFTTTMPMSLSGDKFNVNAAYVDSTKTKAFVFMKNDSGMANIPIDANAYVVMVMNEDYSTPDETVTGGIYILGSTGYMGLYFESDIPFKNNTKHVIIRAMRNTTSNKNPVVYYDESDAYYNQCHLFINFGSYTARTVDFLEGHQMGQSFDFKRVYRTILLSESDKKCRNNCKQAYSDLKDAMLKINESYTRIMETYHDIVLPELPANLTGDKFENVYAYNTDGTLKLDVNGNPITYERFIPKTLFTGGIDFDWYSGDIANGYYRLVPNTQGLSIEEYLDAIPAPNRTIPYRPRIYYENGNVVETDTEYITDGDNYKLSIARDVSNYCAQVERYLTTKNYYQASCLPAFLKLELSSLSVDKLLSVNTNPGAVYSA